MGFQKKKIKIVEFPKNNRITLKKYSSKKSSNESLYSQNVFVIVFLALCLSETILKILVYEVEL